MSSFISSSSSFVFIILPEHLDRIVHEDHHHQPAKTPIDDSHHTFGICLVIETIVARHEERIDLSLQ
jgi:hypothetical protein